MVERRAAVIAADEQGNDEIITQRLYDLQQYVTAHMNTDLNGGVTLAASYERDKQAIIKQASGDQNPNGNIYGKADDFCAPKFNVYTTAYLHCFLSQLEKYPSADELKSDLTLPDDKLYTHDFVSPVWSPDFAGWSVVLCALLLVIIVVRLVTIGILRLMLRHHYKSV
jgi:hypothetical protein